MTATTRYEALRDRIRRRYNLSTTDIDNTVMESLFDDVLDTYSRFRGLRAQEKLTLIAGTADYDLNANVHHIIVALWNDTYPDDDLLTEQYSEEEYNYPSLRVIKDLKDAIRRANAIETDQEHQVYNDVDTKKINLDPTPTTDIYVIYRKLFTKETYPFQDNRIIQWLYEAEMLQHCQSTGLVVQLGDIRFDQKRMDQTIEKLRKKFHSHVCPSYCGRS